MTISGITKINGLYHVAWDNSSSIYQGGDETFNTQLHFLLHNSERIQTLSLSCEKSLPKEKTQTKARAAPLFQTLLDPSCSFSQLRVLNLSGVLNNFLSMRTDPNTAIEMMHLYSRGITQLSPFIARLPNLEHLNLSHCPIRPVQELDKPTPLPLAYRPLFEAISHHPSLDELFLKNCRLSTPDATPLTSALLRNSTLKTLDLSDNPLLGKSILKMQLLQEAIMRHPTLTSVNIANTSMRLSELQYGFKQNTTLKELNLTDNFLSDHAAPIESSPMFNLTALTSLSIGRSFRHFPRRTSLTRQLSDETIKQLILALNGHPSLQSLDLQRSFTIHEAGQTVTAPWLEKLFASINTIPNLTALNIASTDFGKDPAITQIFSDHIQSNTTLQSLSLQNNSLSFSAIYPLLTRTQCLSSLYFGENNLSETNTQELATLLATNTSLKELSLLKTELTAQGIQKIAHGLALNSTLTRLDIRYNEINTAAIDALGHALLHHPTMIQLQTLPPLNFFHANVNLPSLWEHHYTVVNPHLRRNQHNAIARATTLFELLINAGVLRQEESEPRTSSSSKRQRTHRFHS